MQNIFFLGTLELSPKNDTIVMKAFKNNVNNNNAHIDGCGKHESRASDEDCIKIFIVSYHPVVNHYYQGEAPQRRYLPCVVTVTNMHKAYNACHSPISYNIFYRVFKAMKILMTSLGNKECEVCERYKQLQNSCTCIDLCNTSEFVYTKQVNLANMDRIQLYCGTKKSRGYLLCFS